MISNKRKVARLKRIFFLVSVLLVLSILALFLLDLTPYALVGIGIFSLWYIFFHVADYQYIEFSDKGDRIILRYYKVVGFGKRNFNSIEFPKKLLMNVYFENSIFGKLSDLTIVIRTKRGPAEYPSVSLSALEKNDRMRIESSLKGMLDL